MTDTYKYSGLAGLTGFLEECLSSNSTEKTKYFFEKMHHEGWSKITPTLMDQFSTDLDYYSRMVERMHDHLNSLVCQKLIPIEIAAGFLNGFPVKTLLHTEATLKKTMMTRDRIISSVASRISTARFAHDFSINPTRTQKKFGLIIKHYGADPEILGALAYLNETLASKFKLITFIDSDTGEQNVIDYIRRYSEVVVLPPTLTECINRLRQESLDWLFFLNDSTVRLSRFSILQRYKLAQRTAINLSTVLTTASPYIDYFFSSAYYLKRNFQREYTESFLEIPQTPGFSMREADTYQLQKSKSETSKFTVCCSANVLKYTKPFIEFLVEITKIDNVFLTLLPFPPHYAASNSALAKTSLREALLSRGANQDRIEIRESLGSRRKFLEFLSSQSLMVDSFPYPGVTTIADCLQSGTLFLCLQGKVLRNAQAANIAHVYGLDSLIMPDSKSMIEKINHFAANSTDYKEAAASFREKISSITFFDEKFFAERFIDSIERAHRE